MKATIKKVKNNEWQCSILRGNGGISSMVHSRTSSSFWWSFCVFFNLRSWWHAYKWTVQDKIDNKQSKICMSSDDYYNREKLCEHK